MTTGSNDNYSDVVERNAAYKFIADLYSKTSHGKYAGITDEEINLAVEAIKLLRYQQKITDDSNQMKLQIQ